MNLTNNEHPSSFHPYKNTSTGPKLLLTQDQN